MPGLESPACTAPPWPSSIFFLFVASNMLAFVQRYLERHMLEDHENKWHFGGIAISIPRRLDRLCNLSAGKKCGRFHFWSKIVPFPLSLPWLPPLREEYTTPSHWHWPWLCWPSSQGDVRASDSTPALGPGLVRYHHVLPLTLLHTCYLLWKQCEIGIEQNWTGLKPEAEIFQPTTELCTRKTSLSQATRALESSVTAEAWYIGHLCSHSVLRFFLGHLHQGS